MNIRELAYELYKIHWKKTHITPEIEADTIKNYYEDVKEMRSFMKKMMQENLLKERENEELDVRTFEEYLWEQGYGSGTLYVCFNEFLDIEYLDKEYMKELFDNENLYQEYLVDLEQG